MPFGLGFGETLLILAVILLFFGPKRLPSAAASLGKGIREFKRAVSGFGDELMKPEDTVPSTPAAPPHAMIAGTGADPYAVPSSAPAPPVAAEAEPVAAAAESVNAPDHMA